MSSTAAALVEEPTTTANPFNSTAVATRSTNTAIADAGQQRAITEVQAAMTIAKRFPRNQIEAVDKILTACTRPSLAEGALYSYSRGGSEITGPSIRLAEVAAQCWGNIDFGIRELEQSNGSSTVEAFAWDMESNTRQTKVFQVPHVRHTKRGAQKLEDPRDIYELVANNGARRLRACILGVIPGDVIEAAVKQSEQTLRATADTSPEGLKKLAAAFEPFGVTQAQIEKRVQCRLEAIRPAQVVQLKKVYASLRDGMSSPADWFEGAVAAVEGPAAKSSTAALKDKVLKPKAAEAAPTGAPTAQEIHDAIVNAPNKDALDSAYDLVRGLPEADRPAMTALYETRADELDLGNV